MFLKYGAVIARDIGCVAELPSPLLRGRNPADVEQDSVVFGRNSSNALQYAVVIVARIVLALQGKCHQTQMV